jgi:hypothetical protein
VTLLGFVEVSLSDDEAALTSLKPLLEMLSAVPNSTEVISASYVPDAAEALIQLGRLDKAVGARCRRMLLAARGDVHAASRAVELAMTEHDRLPMPFERARTQLLAGQLLRRQRQKDQAATSGVAYTVVGERDFVAQLDDFELVDGDIAE